MFFLSFYLLTVIFTTGSPLKLPPSVLECLLSIPPTPPIDLVYSFDIKAHSVIWLIDLLKKTFCKATISVSSHHCIRVLVRHRLLAECFHSLLVDGRMVDDDDDHH